MFFDIKSELILNNFHNLHIISAQEDGNGYPLKNGNCNDLNIDILEDKYMKPKEPHWFLRRVYILSWIGLYDREKAVSDLIAGITLGLTIIPQSIAYASLAGLSSEYGLYSAFIGAYAWNYIYHKDKL